MGALSTPENLSALFNRVARIAAGTVRAPVAIVTLRRDRKLHIIGTHGLYIKNFDESWNMGSDLVRRTTMSYVSNGKRDPNFKGHPLLKAAPFAKSLAHIPVQGCHSDLEAAIAIINPEVRWPFNADVSAIMIDLSMLVGDALKATDFPAAPMPNRKPLQRTGLSDGGVPGEFKAESKNTAGDFLLGTLAIRTSIRNRKDVSYVTLRTWSKPIKDYQIDALKIVKANADAAFVNSVAQEMADHTRRLFGVPRIGCVVPVPCGHSKTPDCLSVLVAKRLAEILEVSFVEALQSERREGSSHPAKNRSLKAPKLLSNADHEAVLLVDDVASSGRHIELAVQSLRTMAKHVTAMAWIGAA